MLRLKLPIGVGLLGSLSGSGCRCDHILRRGAIVNPRRKAEPAGEKTIDVLTKLLELDAGGRHEALRPYVDAQIKSWGADVFEAIAVAEWEAGDATERLVAEEQRRGLVGLGSFPKEVEDALTELGEEEEATIADVAIGSGATADWISSKELAQLDNAEIADRAEASMLRWEALQRVQEVVFATLAVAWTNEVKRGAARSCAGAEVEGLLAGELSRAASPRGVWITALALAERLVDRGVRWVEAFARGIEEQGEKVPGAFEHATGALRARLHLLRGQGREADCASVAALRGVVRDRWMIRTELIAADIEAKCDAQSAVEIVGAAARAAWALRCRAISGAALDRWGVNLLRLGHKGLAWALAEAALNLFREVGDRRSEGLVRGNLANLHFRAGSPERARELHETALAISREVGDRRCEGICFGNLAILHRQIGSPERARELFEKALAIHRELGNRGHEGIFLGNLALFHHETGSPERALALYEAALAIFREVGDRRPEGVFLGNLALFHQQTGSPERALALYEAALAIHREVGDRGSEGNALGNLANLHSETGSPERARELHEAALAIFREVGDRRSEGLVLGNLANLHVRTGALERARELHEAVLEISREVGDRRGEGFVLANLAALHEETGSLERERELHEAALAISREVGDRRLEGTVLGNLANLHRRTGSPERARELYEATLVIFRVVGDRRSEGIFLGSLANLALDAGDTEAAALSAQDAIAILSCLNDVSGLHTAHRAHASALARTGARDAARAAFRDAIAALESWVRTIGDDTRRVRLLEDALPCFQDTVLFLLEKESPAPDDMEEAFDIAERAKARSLLEAIRKHDSRSQIPAELLEKRKEVETRLRLLQDGRIQELSQSEPRKPMVDFFDSELAKLRAEHTHLLDDLAMRFPAYAAEEGLTDPLLLPEVQARVVGEQDTALVEYFATKEETFVWVIRRDSTQVVRLGLGEKSLAERVDPVIEPFRESSHAVLGVFPGDLRGLARIVFDPLLPYLAGVRRLLVVPSGALHEVPFEMLVLRLPDEAGWEAAPLADRFGSPEYLVERFEVAYGLSATLMDPSLESRQAEDSPVEVAKPWAESIVAAFGDPLYEQLGEEPTLNAVRASGVSFSRLLGTRDEVRAIRRLFPLTRSFVRSRARESAYRRYAPSADLVHLGCHGLVNRDQPAYAGVVLSPGRRKDEDALLQAYEISEIRLKRRPLVVLSACQVAGGKLSAVEGLMGLTRAFVQAGAGVVIASPWIMDDSMTAQLIVNFYEALAGGEGDPITALAAARRAALARARGGSMCTGAVPPAHPLNWAGLRVFGLPRQPATAMRLRRPLRAEEPLSLQ